MIYTDERRIKTAERLTAMREEKGLTHKQLSTELIKKYGKGPGAETLKGLECSNKEDKQRYNKGFGSRIDYLCILADYFQVSVAYLLGETDVKSLDISIRAAADYTGLTEEAIKALHRPPVNTSFTDKKFKPLTSKNGAVTLRPQDWKRLSEPVSVRTKVVNEILEKNPAVIDQIAWFVYVKEFPIVKEPPTYEVDGRTYSADASSHILTNGYLENIKDEVRFLRERIEEERKGKDGK